MAIFHIEYSLQGNPLTVYGDGSQTRSFCYVDDLVDGLLRLMNSDFEEPMNLGNPEEYSILELTEAVYEATGIEANIQYRKLPTDDPKKRRPDLVI